MSKYIYAALTKIDWKYRDLFEKARDELIDLEAEVMSLREDIGLSQAFIDELVKEEK